MKALDRTQLALLVSEAHIKPRIVRELRFVPEEITDWESRDFLAVTNRSYSEGVLIAPLQKTYVVMFRLQKRLPNKAGRLEPITCDFCFTWQRGSNSAIISFIRDDKSSVSFLCCADLACSFHVRDITSASKISRTQLREHLSPQQRIRRLQMKLATLLETV